MQRLDFSHHLPWMPLCSKPLKRLWQRYSERATGGGERKEEEKLPRPFQAHHNCPLPSSHWVPTQGPSRQVPRSVPSVGPQHFSQPVASHLSVATSHLPQICTGLSNPPQTPGTGQHAVGTHCTHTDCDWKTWDEAKRTPECGPSLTTNDPWGNLGEEPHLPPQL